MDFNFRVGEGGGAAQGHPEMEMLRVELEKERLRMEIADREVLCGRLMAENARKRMALARLSESPVPPTWGGASSTAEADATIAVPERAHVPSPEMPEFLGEAPARPQGTGNFASAGRIVRLLGSPDAAPVADGETSIHETRATRENWSCALCNVIGRSKQNLEIHLKGRKHNSAVKELRYFNQTTSLVDEEKKAPDTKKAIGGGRPKGGTDELFFCKPCNLKCNSEYMLDSHLAGKRHRKRCSSPSPSACRAPKGKDLATDTKKADGGTGGSPSPSAYRAPKGKDVATGTKKADGATGGGAFVCKPCNLKCDNESILAKERHWEPCGSPSPSTYRAPKGKDVATATNKADGNIAGGGAFVCKPCNLKCNSLSMFADHLAGKRHRERCGGPSPSADRTPEGKDIATDKKKADGGTGGGAFVCKLCNLKCDNESMLAEERHREPCGELSPSAYPARKGKVVATVTKKADGDTAGAGAFVCKPCDLKCNSLSMLADHLAGKRHGERCGGPSPSADRVPEGKDVATATKEESRGAAAFVCKTCNVKCNSEAMLAKHLAGKKHAKFSGLGK